MPAILFSVEDPAAANMMRRLMENHGWFEGQKQLWGERPIHTFKSPEGVWAHGFPGRQVESDWLSEFVPGIRGNDLLIFASTHTSRAGVKAFAAHASGNWKTAALGGNAHEVSRTSARAIATGLRFFDKHKLAGFAAVMEATHHGPTSLPAPSVWIELGSGPEQWKDEKAGEVAAKALLDVVWNHDRAKGKIAIGAGGTHYCPRFVKMILSGEYCFSHVATKHSLPVDLKTWRQAVERTSEKVEALVIDEKGVTAAQREELRKVAEELDLEFVRAR
ncbi:MAG TPA: D-aminoacyl-tRNA deacylase [Candidatus Norongarragalinales archaeon]|jgi:D-aminoacyl-tRNA deacylase|nr:D-aminoacyl-tRNA deacylase [Candidatus Norongarragalinales archaeon]